MRQRRKELTLRGEVYKVGDCVLVRGDGEALPYIGKIRDIFQERETKLEVTWYYRPEEALGGRKEFHGERELFKSDHHDTCSASTVENKCYVHTLKSYQALDHVGEYDYFARFLYKPTTHDFQPDRVPVYCKCEMPYNPDMFMVMCETCQEWFHPRCLGYTDAQAERWTHFVCHDCVRNQKTR